MAHQEVFDSEAKNSYTWSKATTTRNTDSSPHAARSIQGSDAQSGYSGSHSYYRSTYHDNGYSGLINHKTNHKTDKSYHNWDNSGGGPDHYDYSGSENYDYSGSGSNDYGSDSTDAYEGDMCTTGGGNGNIENSTCSFPFNYCNNTYWECISLDAAYFWCYTAYQQSVATSWGWCVPCNGGRQVTPADYFYDSYTYMEHSERPMDKIDSGTDWDYNYSGSESEMCTTGGGNANTDGSTCKFPFHYNCMLHWECTNKDASDFWCYTSDNGHQGSPWGWCTPCYNGEYFSK